MMKKRIKRRNLAAACLAVCALLCGGCREKGGAVLIGSMEAEHAGQESLPPESPVASAAAESGAREEQAADIRVYVCGAVLNPGVVEVRAGSRAEDALLAAGGFAEDAAREAVNLADWISDGQKLYFPTQGEAVQQQASEEAASAGLVNINTADMAALCTLPGIGESRARDIISYREANGGFGTCEDIMKVSGIKTASYEKIRDKITVK